MALIVSAAVTALALVGCASHHKVDATTVGQTGHGVSTNSSSALIVTPEEGLNGTVTWVNSELRFVVVSFPIGQLPSQGQRLNVYRSGLRIGEVKVNGPQQEDSVVADVITGEAGQGDSVRDR